MTLVESPLQETLLRLRGEGHVQPANKEGWIRRGIVVGPLKVHRLEKDQQPLELQEQRGFCHQLAMNA